MRVNPFYVTNLTNSLNQVQSNEEQLTSQLSSGVKFSSIGEDPVSAGQNVLLLNQIQQDDSFTQSSSLVTGQLQVADSALGSVVSELTSAISLGTQAANGTMNSANEKSIGQQISGIRDEILTLANSNYQGNYIFSGSMTSTAPFSNDSTQTPNVTNYNGDTTVEYLTTPGGQKIQLNLPGSDVFQGTGTNNVFTTLNSMISNLATGTVDANQMATDVSSLNTSLNYVSQQRVVLDNSINQITAASTAITSESAQLQSAQSDLIQADVAQVATKLSLSETQMTALESVIAKLASNSLFDKM